MDIYEDEHAVTLKMDVPSVDAKEIDVRIENNAPTVQVSADYEKGILKINLAKKAEAKPRTIKIDVSGQKTLETKVYSKIAQAAPTWKRR